MWTGLNLGLVPASLAPCGFGAGALPTATAKVSSLARVVSVFVTVPVASVVRSARYQPIPNGAFGTWRKNSASVVLGLKPSTLIWNRSLKPSSVTVTWAWPLGAQAAGRPFERTMSNWTGLAASAAPGPRKALPPASMAVSAALRIVS